MKLLESCSGEKLHNRKIDIYTREFDDDHILVCGELCDNRLVPTYSLEGVYRDATTVHHMQICMKIDVNSLSIEEIEVALPATPHPECAELQKSLEGIQGLRLAPGFTAEVRKRIGGRKGCIHLTTLLLAMAPAALQGYWVKNDRNPEKRELTGDHMEKYLVDSCHVWRRDGELARKIARAAGVKLEPDVKKN